MNCTTILEALVEQRLLSSPVPIREFAGNADRKAERFRKHLLVRGIDGDSLKITIGPSLEEGRNAAVRFARALPQLFPREVFFTRVEECDIWAVEAVDGTVLEELSDSANSAARLLIALESLESKFRAVEQPRDAEALEREWQNLASRVTALPCWTASELVFLQTELLPWLRDSLLPRCSGRRWTSGDFTSSNISVTPEGRALILDAEFASNSHFFPEDAVRFGRISPLCHHHPALLEGWWQPASPFWEVFFQFRQLTLEYQENTDAYLARVVPERKSAIRHFARPCLASFPASWPQAAPPQPAFTGEPVQLFWRDASSPFVESNSRVVSVRTGIRQLVAFRLPGPHAHWRLDPAASQRHVLIRELRALRTPGAERSSQSIPYTIEGGTSLSSVDGTHVHPSGPDPQLHFSLPADSIGLVMEMEFL